jgi:hypothetical protein
LPHGSPLHNGVRLQSAAASPVRSYAFRVADEGREGAPRGAAQTLEHEPPELDPDAVRKSYRVHRARRAARVAHRRRSRMAGARFWIVLLLLVVAFVALATTTWREIGRLFGL